MAAVKDRLDKTPGAAAADGSAAGVKARELRAKIDGIVGGGAGLDAVTAQLATSLNAVESSDRAAPSQALAVYQLARAGLRGKLKEWAELKSGPLAAFDRAYQARELPPVAVRANSR
jgi:hypothetical protein